MCYVLTYYCNLTSTVGQVLLAIVIKVGQEFYVLIKYNLIKHTLI